MVLGVVLLFGIVPSGAVAAPPGGAASDSPAYVSGEFIYETAPFPECHASTIVESAGVLVAAWFGGTYEKHPDVGIWVARKDGGRWSVPVEVANGVESPQKRYPCWNPVLFQPREGPLWLFYKVGPSPSTWWGVYKTSGDGGKTWSEPTRLPEGILGPIKNKPVQLSTGDWLCPSSTEDQGWRVHLERTSDGGRTWTRTPPLNDGSKIGAIQPSILLLGGSKLLAIGRSRQGRVFATRSADDGKTWAAMELTDAPNPNSGIDAVTLRDGRHVMVSNPTARGRTPLSVSISSDGLRWTEVLVLENTPGEYSYPAIIQTKDDQVHITYTWKRQKIKHVVVDPSRLMDGARR